MTSFTTNFIASGDLGSAMQAGVLGGLSAAVTWGVAHGGPSGTSPFGKALPLAHGVVQGGFNELRGGSFKQGFISGVIGKLGGGIVHDSFDKQQVLERSFGIVIVSGIASAASGAGNKDAIMRSAVSVITVYLFNDLLNTKSSCGSNCTLVTNPNTGDKFYVPRGAAANVVAAMSKGISVGEEMREPDEKDLAKVTGYTAMGVARFFPYTAFALSVGTAALDPSFSNTLGAILGPLEKGTSMVDEAIYIGSKPLTETIENVDMINNAVTVGCDTVMVCN